MDVREWLTTAVNHSKETGSLHVSIPIPIIEKVLKHIEAGAAETGEALGKAIGETLFDR